jgi:uncharacterized protein YjgD (DUF1641 family)
MDSKTLIKALKTAVREVIKEELTEILRDGLQDTITEMKQPARTTNMPSHINTPPAPTKKSKVQFTDNKWASILNETDALIEQQPSAMNSLAELMNEGMDDIHMTSNDAQGFGMMRQNMNNSMTPAAPKVMEDPETGKLLEVAPEVAKAMTRDYSQLMKAINNKKGIS